MNPKNALLELTRQAILKWGTVAPEAMCLEYTHDAVFVESACPIRLRGHEQLLKWYTSTAKANPSIRTHPLVIEHVADNVVYFENFVTIDPESNDPSYVHYRATVVWRKESDGWRVAHEHWDGHKCDVNGTWITKAVGGDTSCQ